VRGKGGEKGGIHSAVTSIWHSLSHGGSNGEEDRREEKEGFKGRVRIIGKEAVKVDPPFSSEEKNEAR